MPPKNYILSEEKKQQIKQIAETREAIAAMPKILLKLKQILLDQRKEVSNTELAIENMEKLESLLKQDLAALEN